MPGQVNERIVYLTRARLVELEKELHTLKVKGRAEMAQQIADARAYGDISENSEYDAAKQAQELLEIRISKLEQTLSRVRIINEKDLPNDKVRILSAVRLKDLHTGEELTYVLVSPEEADFEENKISVTSPIGKGLMGKKKGEAINIKAPAGTLEYQIVEIGKK